MKRLVFLFCLLLGVTAAAQKLNNSARYEHFKELRNEADTLGMKQMLDAWGEKDPEYYAAWSNYCSVMADVTEDETWVSMSVNWIKMGRDEYPDDLLLFLKQPEVLFDTKQFEEALPLLLEIEEKGLGDVLTWEFLAEIYLMKNELGKAREYFRKVIQDGDEEEQEMARDYLESVEKSDHLVDSLLIIPDHAAIRQFAQTEDFQKLVTRFEACDTTLTQEELVSLYYGSAYGKNYNSVSSNNADVRKMAEEEGKVDEAIQALREQLKEYPVSLFLLMSIYNLTEDEELIDTCVWKARALLGTIDLSGRGTQECPFQVICVNDEYVALDQICRMQEWRSQELLDKVPNGPLDKQTFINPYGVEQITHFYLTPPYWERLSALSL